jgi:hypothetical protein
LRVKIHKTPPYFENGREDHRQAGKYQTQGDERIGNRYGLVGPQFLGYCQLDAENRNEYQSSHDNKVKRYFNNLLRLPGELAGYEVNAYQLAAPPGNIRPQESCPRKQKHGQIDIPGHGNPKKTQNSGQKDKTYQEHKANPADGHLGFAKGVIYFSHKTTYKKE